MIDPDRFARKQMELAAEFAKYMLAHPEADESIPEGAYVYFEVEGDEEFSQYSRELAARREQAGVPVVCVRTKGLAPPQESRLVEPEILASSRA